jgi:hypothetical protein
MGIYFEVQARRERKGMDPDSVSPKINHKIGRIITNFK